MTPFRISACDQKHLQVPPENDGRNKLKRKFSHDFSNLILAPKAPFGFKQCSKKFAFFL